MIGSYCILHYGKPWLKKAVASIYPQVDKIVILYSAAPSQGFQTGLTCPDTREELMEEVKEFMDKIQWVDGIWGNEGEHNDAHAQYLSDCDWVVRFDADEIFSEGSVKYYVEVAKKTTAKIFRVPFVHYWKSLDRVCIDGQMPERLYRQLGDGMAYLDDGFLIDQPMKYRVHHLSYVQPDEYIKYKLAVSGHHLEMRPGWFDHTWLANKQTDVHPVVIGFWNPQNREFELPKLLQ